LYKIFSGNSNEIVLYGNVEIQDVDVSFRVPGRISEIAVEEGDTVKKDGVLASLDADVFEAKMRAAKALLEEAETSLKNAQKNQKRTLELFKNKSISEKVYDTAQTEYEVAKAKRDSAQASYDIAAIEFKDTKLTSPINGTILTRNVEHGEMISAGIPAFTIMPNEATKIKTFASEKVLSRLKYGDTAYIHNESEPTLKYKGHICYISSEAEFTPKNIETKEVRTSLMYRMRIVLDEDAPSLKQGMPVIISCSK
jgi:HlyD family secretion protein